MLGYMWHYKNVTVIFTTRFDQILSMYYKYTFTIYRDYRKVITTFITRFDTIKSNEYGRVIIIVTRYYVTNVYTYF